MKKKWVEITSEFFHGNNLVQIKFSYIARVKVSSFSNDKSSY